MDAHTDDRAPDSPAPELEENVLRIRRRHLYSALIPLAFVAGLATGFLFWGRDGGAAPSRAAAAGGSAESVPGRLEVEVDDDPAIGPEDAPITIIEFSDFNCPYCRKFHAETFQPLLDQYPGMIRFVYRDYPITSAESFVAAQAAECAEDQGAFWEFHDALFSGRYDLGREAYTKYAEELGLDVEELVACLDSERYAEEVQADARYAAGLGISGTPTFFINGRPMVGAQPLLRFIEIIDDELRN